MIVPVPLAGATGGHRSTQFSSEVTRNMYLDQVNGRWGVHDFPGLKSWGTASGADRGSHVMDGVLYRISGSTLYSVDSDGTHTSRGTVGGSDRAIFANDGTNLLFTVNGTLYKYNGSLSTISQSVITSPSAVTYINSTFILSGSGQTFAVSDVGDPDTWNALNFADAEVGPDDLLRPYVFNQLVYMIGGETTEVWYFSGIGNPPLDRQDTSLVNVGAAGKYAIANTDSFLYWLGNDKKVYKCVGASAKRIDTSSIAHIIHTMDAVEECITSAFHFEGQDFVLFTFPSDNWSLVYSETYDYWVSLGSDTFYPGSRWLGTEVIRCYDKNLVPANGGVYDLDLETYEDNTETRLRIRTLPAFTGALIGAPGSRILVKKLRINMEVGVGLATGQGSDPVIMCEFSPDGGRTWQAESFVEIGQSGTYILPVDFWDFCAGYDVVARISCSDPVFLSMFEAEADIEAAGY